MVAMSSCERRLDPQTYVTVCGADSECEAVRMIFCSTYCGTMAISVDSLEQFSQDVTEIREACLNEGFFQAFQCRTAAFQAACVDGACVLFDIEGNPLGQSVEGPESVTDRTPECASEVGRCDQEQSTSKLVELGGHMAEVKARLLGSPSTTEQVAGILAKYGKRKRPTQQEVRAAIGAHIAKRWRVEQL